MNGWDERLAETSGAGELEPAAFRLLSQQAEAWPLLADGLRGLRSAQRRAITVDGVAVEVRHIPHRMKSTTARVDAASVRARPCFLCVLNLPAEQRGVGFGGEWVALANPFPIVDKHLTIVHRDHTPQRIAGRMGALFALARALPGFFVVYNGPECGASAPDHMHFQAGDRTTFPIQHAVSGARRFGAPFRALVFSGTDPCAMAGQVESAIAALAAVTGKTPEPLVNVAAFTRGDDLVACVFARSKHRPDVFHRGEILVSPAAIDLSGIWVAPRAEDLERLSAEVVSEVYREVLLPDGVTDAALALREPSP